MTQTTHNLKRGRPKVVVLEKGKANSVHETIARLRQQMDELTKPGSNEDVEIIKG